MRKVLLSLTALLLTVGLTLAAPVRLVKFDEDKEIKMEDAVKKMSGEKAVKGFELKADGDTATEIKFVAKKKKKTENN